MNKLYTSLVALFTAVTFASGCNSERNEPEEKVIVKQTQPTNNTESIDDILVEKEPKIIKSVELTSPDGKPIEYEVTITYYRNGKEIFGNMERKQSLYTSDT